MKKILIIISFVVSIFIIGLVSLNSHSVQDRILNIGIKNILFSAEPFLDKDDTLKVVICGSRSPLPSPGRAESCVLVEAGDDIYIFDIGNGSVNNLTQYQLPWPNVKAVSIAMAKCKGSFNNTYAFRSYGRLARCTSSILGSREDCTIKSLWTRGNKSYY